MKKLILFLLLPILALAQNPTNFPYGIKNTGASTSSAHTYVVSQGTNGVYTKTESVMNQNANSGILSGGGLSVNADPTKYDIVAGEGYVSNTLSGTVSKVTWATATAQTTPYLLTAVATYVLKDNTGATVLQTTAPTPQQYRTHIYLGKLAHTTFTTILFAVSEPSRMFNVSGDLHDLVSSFGSINRSGNTISPNGANLQINVSAGETLREGANYLSNRNSPNITTEPAVNATSFRNKFRNGTGGWNAVNTSTVDPNYYDDGTGILALVPNNKFTIKVVYRFGGTGTIHMDYGQVIYDDMDSADRGISAAVSSDPDTRNFASRIGWIIVKQATTSLLDDTKYKFVPADKIGERSAGTSSPTDLQDAYNNSLTPQITTTTDLGAVDIKRGSAADTDKVFRVLNGAGTETFGVTGEGNVMAGTYNGYTPANDANVVHTTGNETIAGIKTFTNSGATNINGISLINNGTTNTYSLFTDNNSTGIGILSRNDNTGIGHQITNSSSGYGNFTYNTAAGYGFWMENQSTGTGLVLNGLSGSSGLLFAGKNNGTNTFTIDKTGNLTAASFIKSGGLSTEYLKADGSVSTLTNPVTGTGTTNYLPKFTGTSTVGNSLIYDDGTMVGIGLAIPSNFLHIFGSTLTLTNENTYSAKFSNGNVDKGVILGYDNTNDFGIISAVNAGVAWRPLLLNPNGGNVLVGGSFPDNGVDKLQVNGSAIATSWKTSGGSATQLVKGDGTLTVGYKVYKALLTQTGTGAPTATVLDNTLGGTVTFTYNATGYYGISRTGAFTAGKVIVFINGNLATTATFGWSRVDANTLEISSFDNSGSAANGLFTNASISIEVYN